MVDLSKSIPIDRYLLNVYNTSIFAIHVNNEVVHIKVPQTLLRDTVVPGLASEAEVELVLLKSIDTLTNNLHLLGTRWLADQIDTSHYNSWLTELLNTSMLTKDWDIDEVWIAVPLERKANGDYCMPMVDPTTKLTSLLNCKTAILADQFTGVTESTLALCSHSLSFLMGQCKLGCSNCSSGLNSASTK